MIRIIFATIAAVVLGQMAFAQASVGFGDTPYDASEEVEVTADSLNFDQNAGTAVFEGDVLILQGDLRMGAARVEVFYGTGDDQQISEVVASGGVTVTRGDEAAEGQTARYDVEAGTLALEGNVLITQGNTAIAGDQLLVDLESGDGQVTGRVRTVLQPDGN